MEMVGDGQLNIKYGPQRYQFDKVVDGVVTQFRKQVLKSATSVAALCDNSSETGSKFSNAPFNTNRETLIDHIFVSKMALDCFTYCEILEDHATNVSTHRPIICKLSIPKNSEVLRLALELPIVSTSDIDNLYSGIDVIINLATDLFIPRVEFKPHIKPYWNVSLKTLHKKMEVARAAWVTDGQPATSLPEAT
ncbi:hypothetical protein MAR_030022 [Mya arenaria]|uniref:Uncharacterized protein n=1 Tax=Mya arenaria TaxID=6604 RepID=A0ABY7DI22_MYAAR|nr:hypothetical protein MAR_030022 [Mya arenaria]